VRVGHSVHEDFVDGGVRADDGFHMRGPYLLAAGVDDIGQPAEDRDAAVVIDCTAVTGGEPTVRVLGVHAVSVAAKQGRGADEELAVRSAHLHTVERTVVVDDAAARLGHAVGGDDVGQ
jgi:hypothetical protein